MNRYLGYGGAVVLALGAAFIGGRYSAPVTVETHVEVQERVREVRTTVIARVVDTKIRRVIVAAPDGSSRTEEAIETHSDERSHEVAENEKSTKTDSATKTVTAQPKLSLSILAGLTVPNSSNHFSALTPTYGAHAQYRLLGPLTVGAWFTTVGSIGLSAGVQF